MRISEIVRNASGDVKIENISNRDIPEIYAMAKRQFEKNLNVHEIAKTLETDVDWYISKKLTVNGKIVGFYLLNEKNVNEVVEPEYSFEDLAKYDNKRGVEGIMLMILPECRGYGFGDMLKELPKALGYDYIFGQQLKNLNNLTDWLKRRRLVGELPEFGGIYVTLADLK